MRIMATSDLHGNLEGLDPRGADMVVLAGSGNQEKRPRFVFCGHIHTGQHGGVNFGTSRIYNVSRLDERYEIAYEPTWIDV